MRKPDFCVCKNKDADQLRSNCAADQHLCFRYTDSTIPLLRYHNQKFQASSHLLWLYSPVSVGPGRKPRRPVFSQQGSYMLLQVSFDMVETSYLPSNINMMTLAGILSSVLKWDFSCSKDWPRVHARVTT